MVIGASLQVDVDDPLQSIASGRSEEQQGGEAGVMQQLLTQGADRLGATQVVHVEAEQAAVHKEPGIRAAAEEAREEHKVEVVGLVGAYFGLGSLARGEACYDVAQGSGVLLSGGIGGDVLVNLGEVYGLSARCIGNRSLVKLALHHI